jgi:hypothetical protein
MLALLVGFNNTVNLNTVSMQEDYCGWGIASGGKMWTF